MTTKQRYTIDELEEMTRETARLRNEDAGKRKNRRPTPIVGTFSNSTDTSGVFEVRVCGCTVGWRHVELGDDSDEPVATYYPRSERALAKSEG